MLHVLRCYLHQRIYHLDSIRRSLQVLRRALQ
nr:MAG TPA: hypothetical protein [Caudoviricetes sp.]